MENKGRGSHGSGIEQRDSSLELGGPPGGAWVGPSPVRRRAPLPATLNHTEERQVLFLTARDFFEGQQRRGL